MSYCPLKIKDVCGPYGVGPSLKAMRLPFNKGGVSSDTELAMKLIRRGSSHAKFSRGITVIAEMQFQAGFMIELDTYRHGREVLSTSSSMHNELRDLSGSELAEQKQKDLTEKVYTQIASYSYPCLRKIYIERRKHRHPDWQIFCDWIETLQSFDWLIMPEKRK